LSNSPDKKDKFTKPKSKPATQIDKDESEKKEDKRFIVDTSVVVDRYKILKLIIVIIKFK